jgi:excisionase family DNA binding protein
VRSPKFLLAVRLNSRVVDNVENNDAAKPSNLAEQTMTLTELAQYLDVPRTRLYKVIKREECFPAFKVGRKWCANVEQVREWMLLLSEKKGVGNS